MSEAETRAKALFQKKFDEDQLDNRYQTERDLTTAEYNELSTGIKSKWEKSRILIDEEGNIIDGHHRVRIAKELDLEFADEDIDVMLNASDGEKREASKTLNRNRRHLTNEEKQELITKELKKDPNQSNNTVAGKLRVSDTTVGRVRRDLEETNQLPTVGSRKGKDGRSRPAKKKTSALNLDFKYDNDVLDFFDKHELSSFILRKHNFTIEEQRTLQLKLACTLSDLEGTRKDVLDLAVADTVRAYVKSLKDYQREQKAERAKGYIGKLIKSKHRDLPDLYEFTFTLSYDDMRQLRAYIKEKDSGSIEKHDLDYHLTELVRYGAIVGWGDSNDD